MVLALGTCEEFKMCDTNHYHIFKCYLTSETLIWCLLSRYTNIWLLDRSSQCIGSDQSYENKRWVNFNESWFGLVCWVFNWKTQTKKQKPKQKTTNQNKQTKKNLFPGNHTWEEVCLLHTRYFQVVQILALLPKVRSKLIPEAMNKKLKWAAAAV